MSINEFLQANQDMLDDLRDEEAQKLWDEENEDEEDEDEEEESDLREVEFMGTKVWFLAPFDQDDLETMDLYWIGHEEATEKPFFVIGKKTLQYAVENWALYYTNRTPPDANEKPCELKTLHRLGYSPTDNRGFFNLKVWYAATADLEVE